MPLCPLEWCEIEGKVHVLTIIRVGCGLRILQGAYRVQSGGSICSKSVSSLLFLFISDVNIVGEHIWSFFFCLNRRQFIDEAVCCAGWTCIHAIVFFCGRVRAVLLAFVFTIVLYCTSQTQLAGAISSHIRKKNQSTLAAHLNLTQFQLFLFGFIENDN